MGLLRFAAGLDDEVTLRSMDKDSYMDWIRIRIGIRRQIAADCRKLRQEEGGSRREEGGDYAAARQV